MSFLELLLVGYLLYKVVYVLLWLLLDCNVALWYNERFGVPLSSMRGQVVWITGASSGIGRALALSLARHGVRLELSARRKDKLQDVHDECIKEASGLLADTDVLVLPLDMLELNTHNECFRHVIDYFGELDVLVNNAGRSQRANWQDIQVQVDRDLFELDVFSVVHLSRIAVRYFLEHREGCGHIAVTSSIAGLNAVPFSATYCAAKSALNAYMNALRLELPTVSTSVFAPGPIQTDFLNEAFTEAPGSKVGKSTKNQKRMSAERCGDLFAVTIANKMDLTWCGLFPVNALGYVARSPTLAKVARRLMGPKILNKIREGKL